MDSKKRKEIEDESTYTSENRERKDLVTLGGTARTLSGKLTKSNYFRFLQHDLNDYEDIELNPQEARKIHTHLQKLSTGATAMVPLYCAGHQCPFAHACPLVEINKAPLGRQCILEVQLLKEWTLRYFEEYEVDPNNFTEIGYINELAEIVDTELENYYLYEQDPYLSNDDNGDEITVYLNKEGGDQGSPVNWRPLFTKAIKRLAQDIADGIEERGPGE